MPNELTDVRVEYSNEVTVNTGNFQNTKPGYRVSASVADGVHPNVAKEKLKALVDGWMEQDIAQIHAEMNS